MSSSDYSRIAELLAALVDKYGEMGVSVSLPSLRTDKFAIELAQTIEKVRKTGLTFAPEAGSQRLRDVINKGVTEEDLISTAQAAFSTGWRRIKLYFMIGLPTETDDDVLAIAQLAKKFWLWEENAQAKERGNTSFSERLLICPQTPHPFSVGSPGHYGRACQKAGAPQRGIGRDQGHKPRLAPAGGQPLGGGFVERRSEAGRSYYVCLAGRLSFRQLAGAVFL